MWYQRDFNPETASAQGLPIKILKGPRQVGKTSLLERLGRYQALYFDDLGVRRAAEESPRLFFDQFTGPLLLDEATLAPAVFPELKRRVDEERRLKAKGEKLTRAPVDIWITGSNQTLLQKTVSESLAGRASYFDLGTLSIHELGKSELSELFFRGGWPELQANPSLNPIAYLNDLISTFIEKDIVAAAGIEKKAAFTHALHLCAARVGQMFVASDVAKTAGVDITTVQSWVSLAAQNGILRMVRPFFNNLNQRLIKTPKIYFEDTALATRFQGWTEFQPLFLSPASGLLIENIAVTEVCRFFQNRGEKPEIHFVRSKEKVEVDLLIQLPNQRYVAAEIKTTPQDLTREQMKLLDSTHLNIVERWIISPTGGPRFQNAEVVEMREIWDRLGGLTS